MFRPFPRLLPTFFFLAAFTPAFELRPLHAEDDSTLPESGGLVVAWSQPGKFRALTVDLNSNVFAVDSFSRCSVFDPTGKLLRKFPFADRGQVGNVRTARLVDSKTTSILVISGSGGIGTLTAIADGGKRLWETEEQAIRDFRVADLDADGIDEVIYTWRNTDADAGVCVVDNSGTPIWKAHLPFPERLRIADLDGDGRVEIICHLHPDKPARIFASDGQVFANVVAENALGPIAGIVRLPKTKFDRVIDSKIERIPVGEDKFDVYYTFAMLNEKGNAEWVLEFPEGVGCGVLGDACPSHPWLALGFGSIDAAEKDAVKATLAILNAADGKLIASLPDRQTDVKPDMGLQIAWVTPPGADFTLLLVANGDGLTAYTVKPTSLRQPIVKKPAVKRPAPVQVRPAKDPDAAQRQKERKIFGRKRRALRNVSPL